MYAAHTLHVADGLPGPTVHRMGCPDGNPDSRSALALHLSTLAPRQRTLFQIKSLSQRPPRFVTSPPPNPLFTGSTSAARGGHGSREGWAVELCRRQAAGSAGGGGSAPPPQMASVLPLLPAALGMILTPALRAKTHPWGRPQRNNPAPAACWLPDECWCGQNAPHAACWRRSRYGRPYNREGRPAWWWATCVVAQAIELHVAGRCTSNLACRAAGSRPAARAASVDTNARKQQLAGAAWELPGSSSALSSVCKSPPARLPTILTAPSPGLSRRTSLARPFTNDHDAF